MKILLTQPEIEQAVREFVNKGVKLADGSEMTVEFSMGRGENGLTAAIDVPYMGVSNLPVTPVAVAAPSLVTGATTANVAAAASVPPRITAQAAAPATAPAADFHDPATTAAESEAEAEAAPAPVTSNEAAGRSLFNPPAA